jgi:hypothetical protein
LIETRKGELFHGGKPSHHVESWEAASDLSTNQGYPVRLTFTGSKPYLTLATPSGAIIGILMDKPPAGQPGAVCTSGTVGAQVESTPGGQPAGSKLSVGSGNRLTFTNAANGVAISTRPIPDSGVTAGPVWMPVKIVTGAQRPGALGQVPVSGLGAKAGDAELRLQYKSRGDRAPVCGGFDVVVAGS